MVCTQKAFKKNEPRQHPWRQGAVGLAILLLAAGRVFAAPAGPPLLPGFTPVDRGFGNIMWRDPALPSVKPVQKYNLSAQANWRLALQQPDSLTRCRTCQALAESARAGMPGLGQFLPQLLAIVRNNKTDAVLQRAAVEAIIAMNASSAAETLFSADGHGDWQMALLCDAALARWHFQPALRLWLARVNGAATNSVVRLSAVQALGKLGDKQAVSTLRRVALAQRRNLQVRLAALQSLHELHAAGMAVLAAHVVGLAGVQALGKVQVEHVAVGTALLAVTALDASSRPDALQDIAVWAGSSNTAVAALAMQGLLRAHSPLAGKAAPALAHSPDSVLRRLAAEAFLQQANAQSVAELSKLLGDPRRFVRWYARHALSTLGGGRLRPQVLEVVGRIFVKGNALARRQAALVAGRLNFTTLQRQLLHVLRYDPSLPVRIGAAAAFRRLQLAGMLPALLAYAQETAEASASVPTSVHATTASLQRQSDLGGQLSQLFQLFGAMRYAPAQPLIMRLIPKHSPYSGTARTAAIWALGKINRGRYNAGLARQLKGRLDDLSILDPELESVRIMSAEVLGRMGSKTALATLRSYYISTDTSSLCLACRWAIGRITGKEPPLPKSSVVYSNQFLPPTR